MSALTSADAANRLASENRDMSGWATQVPVATASLPAGTDASVAGNADGATTTGP